MRWSIRESGRVKGLWTNNRSSKIRAVCGSFQQHARSWTKYWKLETFHMAARCDSRSFVASREPTSSKARSLSLSRFDSSHVCVLRCFSGERACTLISMLVSFVSFFSCFLSPSGWTGVGWWSRCSTETRTRRSCAPTSAHSAESLPVGGKGSFRDTRRRSSRAFERGSGSSPRVDRTARVSLRGRFGFLLNSSESRPLSVGLSCVSERSERSELSRLVPGHVGTR